VLVFFNKYYVYVKTRNLACDVKKTYPSVCYLEICTKDKTQQTHYYKRRYVCTKMLNSSRDVNQRIRRHVIVRKKQLFKLAY